MIFREHELIFFHPGKTAGTAIEFMLRRGPRDPMVANRSDMFGMDPELGIYLHHATCQTTLDLVGPTIFDEYFKFAVVRNPYSRLLSAYYYLHDDHLRRYGSFRDYVLRLPEFVEHPVLRRGSHPLSQRHYTHIDREQVVDHIGRFEAIDETVALLSSLIGTDLRLPEVNVQDRREYLLLEPPEAYDDEMLDVMRRVYADDFDLYGYCSETPPPISL